MELDDTERNILNELVEMVFLVYVSKTSQTQDNKISYNLKLGSLTLIIKPTEEKSRACLFHLNVKNLKWLLHISSDLTVDNAAVQNIHTTAIPRLTRFTADIG